MASEKKTFPPGSPGNAMEFLCQVICYIYITRRKQTQTCTTLRKLLFALFLKILVCSLEESQLKPGFIDSLSTWTGQAMVVLKISHLKAAT